MVCICIGAVGVFLVKKMFLAVYNVVVFQDFGLKMDPTHTQQVLPSHGSKPDSIVRHTLPWFYIMVSMVFWMVSSVKVDLQICFFLVFSPIDFQKQEAAWCVACPYLSRQ